MELAEGIRRLGFRRWYERQLIESHLYLVSSLLCAVLVFACVEGFSLRAPCPEPFLRLVIMAGGGWLGTWALVRYLTMLTLAGRAAERAVCGKCSAYGMLEVAGPRSRSDHTDTGLTLTPVRVCCRKCGHEWTIE